MSRTTPFLALILGGLAASTAAFAGGWGDYADAFPLFPCQDGWMACLVDGESVNPDLLKSGKGLPVPSSMRVSWDTLEPTHTFSPFAGLSPYTGQLAVAEADPPAEAPPSEGTDAVADAQPPEAPPEAPPSERSGSADPAPTTASTSSGSVRPASGSSEPAPASTSSGSVRPSNAATATAPASTTPSGTSGSVRPSDASSTASSGSVRPASGATAPVAAAGTADAARTTGSIQVVAPTTTAAVAAAPADDSCDNLTKLEPPAMLGKLSDGQIACLEGSYAAASKPTDRDKISRILMANAYSKGDIKGWEKLIKRHLEEIDQSDPDLCYKYAVHLSKGGAARATGVIRWANVALDNRTIWTGDTYVSRVSGLYKLRAAAAQSLWKAAEDEHAKAPTDDTKKKVDDARSQTKVFAREWYEYLKQAGKDTTVAQQLCVSAAGTADYCEGR